MNTKHEAILSLGGRAEIGGTGSKAIGTDRFQHDCAQLFWTWRSAGFVWILRPFALTGQAGVSFPTRSERKSIGLKSRTVSAQVHCMHKRLMDGHKQWVIKGLARNLFKKPFHETGTKQANE